MDCPIPQGSCINSFVYSFSSALVWDDPDEANDESESEEDKSESVCHRVALDGVGKVVPGAIRLVTDGPDIQKLLDVHNGTHHPMQFLDPVRKGMSIYPVCVTAHAPCMHLARYPAATADGLGGRALARGGVGGAE